MRVFILDVISTCANRASRLSNPKEIVSMFLLVLESNDPIAKALTIRALGILSCISHASLEFQYILIRCLKDAKASPLESNQVQLNAVVFSSYQIANRDERFATKLCDLIFNGEVPPIPELCNAFKCLKSIFNIVRGMKQLLVLLEGGNAPLQMRSFLYKSRTILACISIVYSTDIIGFLIHQLKSESESIQFHIFECLVFLSKKVPCSFSTQYIGQILGYINDHGLSGRCIARGAEALYHVISLEIFTGDELLNNINNEINQFLNVTLISMLRESFKYCKFILFFGNELLAQTQNEFLQIGNFFIYNNNYYFYKPNHGEI